jgi:hypothetical protein
MAIEQLYLGGDRRSVRPWLIGALLVLGAALIGWWLIGGQDDRPRSSASSQVGSEAFEQSPATIEQSESAIPRGAVETSELFAPKDPFDPLISTDATGAGRAAGASARSSRGRASAGERKVLLVASTSRHGGTAEVRVDGTSYTVARGEVFADHFKLLAASGDCVAMLFGDQEFTLCEGDEILK